MLVDDDVAAIGTAIFDNRSFRLNVETMLLFNERRFVWEVERMLEENFVHSRLVTMADVEQSSFIFKLAARASRLLSPVLQQEMG